MPEWRNLQLTTAGDLGAASDQLVLTLGNQTCKLCHHAPQPRALPALLVLMLPLATDAGGAAPGVLPSSTH